MTKQEDSLVLVVGATGTVGGAAVRELLAKGARVRVLCRSMERARRLSGVEVVLGDLRDASAVEGLFAGVHSAFYVSPHELDEELLAETFIRACEKFDVRLVFLGVHVDARVSLVRALLRLYFGRLMPTYVPKLRISERARNSRANPVVLMPTNYFENDEIFMDEILAGTFLQPFERPFNRVSVQDIGVAAARACLDPALPSGAYPLVGPESLDGPACAAAWSEALGHKVTYRADEAALRALAMRSTRGKKAADLIESYAAIRRIALPTSKRDLARTTELLGRPPTSYAAYVGDVARKWSAQKDRRAMLNQVEPVEVP